jgi:heme a synthase
LNNTAIRGFRRLCRSTLIAVYFLILVGGIVRSTGSGMGCPDWPKCFGSFIPPTSVDQLPSNYKENYAAFRAKKNQKFASYLQMLGMNSTADKILSDQSILNETEFNPVKTWIEYLNRLVGVAIGIFIALLFFRSIKFRKDYPILFWLSLATLVSVVFQGWFGSIVVSTNLTTWTITIHFVLALVIVALLVFLLHKIDDSEDVYVSLVMRGLLLACISVLLVQIFLGTEVRAAIDVLSVSLPRIEWIGELGDEFVVHRLFSWVVLFVNGFFFWHARKTIALKALSITLFLLILSSFATGVLLSWFNVPAAVQPVHLTIATVTIGVQLTLFFRMKSV